MQHEIRIALLPKDEADERAAILEIRPAAGGDEAALFAAELFAMYQRYAERHGWRFEILEYNDTELGGLKEGIAEITGRGVFARLKYESGVHRVQRVPATESQGRIHTSTVTVAVLPEAEEVDVQVDESDLRIDVYRASGAGGQHVNKTESAVRITHLPTGIVVAMQEEKSQHKNRAKAMKILRARLYEQQRAALHATRAADRKAQVGTGDRTERIRTYNFPQGRVSDHRINLTLYKIDRVMAGRTRRVHRCADRRGSGGAAGGRGLTGAFPRDACDQRLVRREIVRHRQVLLGITPRVLPQPTCEWRILQRPQHRLRQSLRIEERHQQPVLLVRHELAHRRRVAADHDAARGQRLAQRP